MNRSRNGSVICLVGLGIPDFVRSDNSTELAAFRVRDWLQRVGVKTLLIETVSTLRLLENSARREN